MYVYRSNIAVDAFDMQELQYKNDDDTDDGDAGETYCDDFSPVFAVKKRRGTFFFILHRNQHAQKKKTAESLLKR